MNPFLHDPVAAPLPALPRTAYRHAPRWPLISPRQPGPASPARARRPFARAAGCLAVAGGLGLAAMPAQALDVNAASVEQLQTLRGVGPRTAQIIVQERERAGPYESLQDLSERVRGIGRKRLEGLQAAGLAVGAGVPVLTPGSVATPQFAPALPGLSAP
ncbi:DUF655 domain-containing protein [Bordetella sp. BOR01]|uniref:ComEA family DNA-binding protein n=1 Tax=Bordetella sp. BOR01 TaxID=2854779 RepID=UPI001C456558|nr:DUF655 domain-containing protein [Bordetella sp. BOR01]MBV7482244.1 DUF655 domain-containing protein [Bordetella sp. BOR01]